MDRQEGEPKSVPRVDDLGCRRRAHESARLFRLAACRPVNEIRPEAVRAPEPVNPPVAMVAPASARKPRCTSLSCCYRKASTSLGERPWGGYGLPLRDVSVSHVPEGAGTAGIYVDARLAKDTDDETDGVTLSLSRDAALWLANALWTTVDERDEEEAA